MSRKNDRTSMQDRNVVAEPASYRSIATRFGNLATNLLVTGVILIVGIAFSREVISWWRSKSSPAEPSPLTAVVGNQLPAANASHHLLEFGDFPFALNRQELVGTVAEVLEQLRAASRSAVTTSKPLTHDFGAAEQRMLSAAKRLAPVEQQANLWSIYQIDAPLPMVVGVRSFDPQVATPDQRVVSWGLAVPSVTPEGEQQSEWTLFTYSSDASTELTSENLISPAPPGGQRTLSLRTDRSSAIVGYAGVGTVESWTIFYDRLFGESASRPNSNWQVDFGTWRRQFTRADSETVDVVIRLGRDKTLRSLVITSPLEPTTHD
ncbi:MAG: hypothetical protein H8E66_34065 [Planctomycetes bacterium]|nr:hypothetical protein [Planctomycetota bacterium]